MAAYGSEGSSRDYFRTIPRRMVSLWTGEIYDPPIDGRQGGHPCRFQTDEEYKASQEAYDRMREQLSQPPPPTDVKPATSTEPTS